MVELATKREGSDDEVFQRAHCGGGAEGGLSGRLTDLLRQSGAEMAAFDQEDECEYAGIKGCTGSVTGGVESE